MESRHNELQHRFEELIGGHATELRTHEEKWRVEINSMVESRTVTLTADNQRLNEELHRVRSSFESRITHMRQEISEQLRLKEVEIMGLRQEMSQRSITNIKECERKEREVAEKYNHLIEELERDVKTMKFQLSKYQQQYGYIKSTTHHEDSDHEEGAHTSMYDVKRTLLHDHDSHFVTA